ncbi:MAG TPA: hypothetical protein VKE94_01475, partial [Gemmataceae bacterium]|nr:hypothetical protein [Gemmataceae bacterium]
MTDYKTRAKAAFEALLAVRGEDGALAAVAALYWVSPETLPDWFGLPPEKKPRARRPDWSGRWT